MKLLYDWLREYADVPATAAELRARLSLVGVPVDAIEESPAGPVLDAEITANRPDCLGHYGVAREAAAIYRLPLKPVPAAIKESGEKASAATRVEIEYPEGCGRFTARILRGVKVQPSPEWLRRRLESIGQKSINNVVDVTNYVLFELGQPLHAYDFDKLSERRIVVRRARPAEKIRTLDGVERALPKDACMIADGSRAVGIGGVMGGEDSEISFSSRNLLLEAAWFDPGSIRRTAKALGMRTEASYRFERGVDPEIADLASRRAAGLIQQLGGGEILEGVVDVYPRREAPRKIPFSRRELTRVMGADVPDRDIEEILAALGFAPRRKPGASGEWDCAQASWRRDVTREIDLIEEVARQYGYDKFPPRLPPAKQPARRLPHAEAETRLRERAIALGYQEISTIPLVDARRDALFRPAGAVPAAIENPLAEDASVMRSSGTVSMVDALEWNLNHGQRNLRLFEIAKSYALRDGEPVETPVLTLGATGLARDKTIYEPERDFAFADMKGDLDSLGELAGGFTWRHAAAGWLAAGRAADISVAHNGGPPGAHAIGVAGRLARAVAESLKLRQEIFLAELELRPLLESIEAAQASRRFEPLPRFPAVERDFSLVLADGITFAQVAEAIRALGITELRGIQAADLFRGGQIPAGKYSLMIRVTFQSSEATLTDPQIAAFSSRVVATLEQRLGASLRAS